MNRRQVLAVVGGIGVSLSGCLDGESTPAQPTDSPTPSPTDASTDSPTPTQPPESLSCPEAPDSTPVEVPPWPERPESFTRESVERFATEFERAYVTRTTLHQQTNVVSITVNTSATDAEITETDDGWLVRFWVVGPRYRYRPAPDSTETAHVDPPTYLANYFITDESVFRARSIDPVDPRETGSAIECPL